MKILKILSLAALLFCPFLANAQLAVTVSPVKVAGQKAIVPLAMKNNFAEKIESARAVVFLLDEQGKVVGQPTTRWVIGGSGDKPGLAPGATNVFNFVVTTTTSARDKPPTPSTSTSTNANLTAKVQFSRVVLEGGKVADVAKEIIVIVTTAATPVAK